MRRGESDDLAGCSLLSLHYRLHAEQLRQRYMLTTRMLHSISGVLASVATKHDGEMDGLLVSLIARQQYLLSRWMNDFQTEVQQCEQEVDEAVAEGKAAAAETRERLSWACAEILDRADKAARHQNSSADLHRELAGKRRRTEIWAAVGRQFADSVRPGLRAALDGRNEESDDEEANDGEEAESEEEEEEGGDGEGSTEHDLHAMRGVTADRQQDPNGGQHEDVAARTRPVCGVCGRNFKHWGAATTHERSCRAGSQQVDAVNNRRRRGGKGVP